jgi:hypothetical protein
MRWGGARRLAAGVLFLVLVAAPASAQASVEGARWRNTPVPSPPSSPYSYLYRIACAKAFDCMAVGTYANAAFRGRTLSEHWDGTAWHLLDTPTVPHVRSAELNDVDCLSPNRCLAVGDADGSAFVEWWNGSRWKLQTLPGLGGRLYGSLGGVSCIDWSDCVAVGSSSGPEHGHALIIRWDGASWTEERSGRPKRPANTFLNSVSCPSAEECVAVGTLTVRPTYHDRTLVERWNGRKWSIVPSPNSTDPQLRRSYLVSISCPAPGSCTAVGSAQGGRLDRTAGLVESWNGARWTLRSPPFDHRSMLSGVSCTRAVCVAVGSDGDRPLVERWNGSAWIRQSPPTPHRDDNGQLFGVDCAAPEACMAVGSTARLVRDHAWAARYSR